MIFNTWTFGAFVLVFFFTYWLTLKPQWRPVGLLAAGLAFYAYYYTTYTVLIVLLALFTYGSGLLISKFRSKKTATGLINPLTVMWLSVAVCILVLGYFKYLRMLFSTVNTILNAAGINKSLALPEILLPLGLSFFIFEFIHYLVDSYYGRIKDASLLEFGTFVMFFPTMVAGPIKRFQPFASQIRKGISFRAEFLTQGLWRITTGFAKKILIADIIGEYATPLTGFAKNPEVSPLILWLAVYAYAIKIYFDFSGYSDIAIGCAKLFGIEVPENFNKPYLRQNIAEFWKNWHMSLTTWLRDYIYMPVGKKLMPVIGRKSPLLLAAICQMITMGVSGLWHGAAWNFVIWGLYHGALLTLHRIFSDAVVKQKRRQSKEISTPLWDKIKKPVYTLLTFQFVCIGWIFFVLDINTALQVIKRLLWV